jgi:hypothetical protein
MLQADIRNYEICNGDSVVQVKDWQRDIRQLDVRCDRANRLVVWRQQALVGFLAKSLDFRMCFAFVAFNQYQIDGA